MTHPTADLRGHAALVTGASRGIGYAIAAALLARGAAVAVTARKPDELRVAADELVGMVEAGADRVLALPGNAGDPAARAAAVDRTVERFGSLDVLVNNVGINPMYGPLIEADLDTVRKIFDVNVVAALGFVQLAWKAWMSEHGGSVLIVASVAGLKSSEGIAAYGVSKAALVNLTTQLAVELGPKVRVNAVAPAVVKTRFAEALFTGREDALSRQYPAGRLGAPEDIGEAAAYLLGDSAGWVTGQTLVLDGGALSRGPI
jgi:NAD(P)-dependent dehydrogenase (short-subunit alcohol dehydrogenase family)